jgi:DNA-binding MarR family transcriptional regulator
MHPLPFIFKRLHHRMLFFARPFAKFFNTTPARADMLERLRVGVLQSALPYRLGVSRATISRMLIALERLGLIIRTPYQRAGRTYRRLKWVELTAEGRKMITGIRGSMIYPWFQTAFEEHLRNPRRHKTRRQVSRFIDDLSATLNGLAIEFLDTSRPADRIHPLIDSLRVHWTSVEEPFKPHDLHRTYCLLRDLEWPPPTTEPWKLAAA